MSENIIIVVEKGSCIECGGEPPLCGECFLKLIKSEDIMIEGVKK